MNNKECKTISYFYGYIIMIYTLAEGLFGYGFTAFMYEREINLMYIGILLGMTDLFTTIFDYPSGNFADKYGRKKICGMGFIFYGIGFLIFASAHSLLIFFISCIIRAFGISLISGAPISWYLGELSKRGNIQYKDKVLPVIRGLSLLFGSLSGVIAVGIASINLAFPIYIGGILLIFSGIVILMLFEDNKSENIENINIIVLTIKNTRSFIKNKNMNVLVMFALFNSVPFTVFILSWQVFATESVGIEVSYLGFLYTAMLLLMSFSSFLTRYLLKHFKGPIISIIGALILCMGMVLFIFSINKTIFIVGFLLFELGIGILNSSYYTWLYDYIPENVLSSYTSALSSIGSLMSFVLSLFMGGLIQKVGYNFGWIIAIFFELIAIYFLFKIVWRKECQMKY